MKYLVFFTVLFSWCGLMAQQDAEVTVPPVSGKNSRSDYIKGYPDHFFIWPVLKQRRLDFDLRMLTGDKSRLNYKSNKPYSLGVGIYIFELAVELAFAIPLDEQNKRLFGESKARDLQLNAFGRRWGFDIYHQKYKGFYIDDAEKKVPSNTPFPQRPDISTRNVGLTVNYIFNKNRFSFRSPYNFSERQLRSGGSFLVFSSLRNFRVSGDSSITGVAYRETFGELVTIRKIDVTLLGLAPGYTYSLVYKGFFLNGTLAVGPGHNWIGFERESGLAERKNDISAMVAARLALGYNGDRIFGGLAFMNQGGNAKFANMEVTSMNSSFKILAGYRFKESGFLKKRIWDIPSALFH